MRNIKRLKSLKEIYLYDFSIKGILYYIWKCIKWLFCIYAIISLLVIELVSARIEKDQKIENKNNYKKIRTR